MLAFTVSETDHCRAVFSFLARLLPSAPPSYLRKLVSSGHLQVNGIPAAPETLLLLGDRLTLKESSRTASFLKSTQPELEILFEDSWLIAFNKAPGMAVHRAAEVGEHNLVDLGSRLLALRGDSSRLRPVNRLDRGTSGVILTAKSSGAAGMFGRVVKEEGLGKLYLAVVPGRLPPDGTITVPIDGKESETRYRVLHQGSGRALAAVWPLTGRMHQIRRHFQAAGHPVLGDRRYGGGILDDYPGIALHSFRTTLPHPATGATLIIYAPLPSGMLELIRRLAGAGTDELLRSLPLIPQISGRN